MASHHQSRVAPFERDSLPLDCARTAFEWLVTGPKPVSIEGRCFPGLPTRRIPLDELRGLLLDAALPMPVVDRVWAHLVTRSREEGGTWTVACVGLALPALFAIAAELCAKYADDHRDVHAAVLTGFLSELASIDLARPWVMWRLRCAALREGHRFVRDALERPLPCDEDFGSSAPSRPWGHEDFVLARAVAEGVITGAQAELIGATRLEPEYTLAQAAVDRGVSYKAVEQVRRRAEHKLAAWLADQAPHDDPADPYASDVETRAVHTVTITTAARPATTTPPRAVDGVDGKSVEKVRHGVLKKTPKSGVESCGDTPVAPAHTTSPTRPARTIRRASGTTSEDASMRLIRSAPHRQSHRGDDRQPTAGPRPLAQPAHRTRFDVSRSAVPEQATPSVSRGRWTPVRWLVVGVEVAALALVLSAVVSMPPARADTTHVLALAGSVDQVLTNIRNWVMGILAGLATVFLSIGGVRYVMAGGDPGEVEKAKSAFKAAGIGYGLAALAPLVVTVLQGIVGA